MSKLITILQTPEMQNALLTSLLISIACGIVGVYVVINRLVFISGGISHASLGGVGIGIQLGISNLLIPTLGFSLLTAFLMGFVRERFHERIDTLIGVIWALGMGLGILLIESSTGSGEEELESYLFGSIDAVSQSDLLLMLVVNLAVVLTVILLYKELLAVSFDRTFSTIRNLPVSFISYLLLGLIAITIVILMRAVGLILVIALLTIPAAIAGQYTRNLKKMIANSMLLSLLFTITGLLIATAIDVSEGPMIVMTAGVGYLLSLLIQQIARQRNYATE